MRSLDVPVCRGLATIDNPLWPPSHPRPVSIATGPPADSRRRHTISSRADLHPVVAGQLGDGGATDVHEGQRLDEQHALTLCFPATSPSPRRPGRTRTSRPTVLELSTTSNPTLCRVPRTSHRDCPDPRSASRLFLLRLALLDYFGLGRRLGGAFPAGRSPRRAARRRAGAGCPHCSPASTGASQRGPSRRTPSRIVSSATSISRCSAISVGSTSISTSRFGKSSTPPCSLHALRLALDADSSDATVDLRRPPGEEVGVEQLVVNRARAGSP